MPHTKGIRVPKESLTDQQLSKYKKDLTVTPHSLADMGYGSQPESYPAFRESKTHLYLPRYAPHIGLGEPPQPPEGHPISVTFRGTLRNFQEVAAQGILEEIRERGSGILCLGCGYGKTFIALWVLSQLQRKTLIVVHKEFLMHQWIERIQEFIPNAKIGTLRQSTIDIEGRDIVVAMLQSLTVRKAEYPEEIFQGFGFSIFDECHHICSRTFSKALWKVATHRSLGLSATPQRKDGTAMVLEWFLGRLLVFGARTGTHTGRGISVPTVRYVSANYEREPIPTYNHMGKVILPTLITKISQDPVRNKQILGEVLGLLREGRKILVLSERRGQCELLKELLEGEDVGEVGLYIGGRTKEELANANTQRVILATYNMAAEGYDCDTLDTLVMATGRSDIEQSVGRILRKENRNVPLVIDFVDSVEGLVSQAAQRRRYYRKCKFHVEGSKEEGPKEEVIEFLD